MRLPRSVLLALTMVCAPGGCAREEAPPVALAPSAAEAPFAGKGGSLDLVELLPLATLDAETEEIDFGTRDARRHLVRGWSTEERWGRRDGVWSVGEESEIEVYLSRARPLGLRLACWPLPAPGMPVQRMTIFVNGDRVTELALDKAAGASYSVPLAARNLRSGSNRIVFRYAWTRRPKESTPDSPDVRPLAVAWDRLWLQGARRGRPPRGESGPPSRLQLPGGSRVRYVWSAAPATELVVDRVRAVGEPAEWSLRVRAQADGEARERLVYAGRGSPPEHGVRIAVTGADATPVRISIEAWTSEPSATLELERPRLESAVAPVTAAEPGVAADDRSPGDRPHIVLYVVDTLRSDHLGSYGYGRPTSPAIDAFAREAVLFEAARAQSSWTRPAMASIFTGRYPHAHGVEGELDALGDGPAHLAERLSRTGYYTAAVVTNGVVSRDFGFARGFDAFEYLPEDRATPEVHRSSRDANAAVRGILAARPADRPLFLWVHTTDPHAPYQPAPEWLAQVGGEGTGLEAGNMERTTELYRSAGGEASPQLVRDLTTLYDAEVAANDAAFGALLGDLDAAGIRNRAWIVLTSDHGEEFHEHGRWQHGLTLYEEQLRIPLIVRPPGGSAPGRRVPHSVGQVDLLPTLLAVADVELPPGIQGRSLLPLIAGPEGAPFTPSGLFAELARHPRQRRLEASWDGGYKAIRNRAYDQPRPARELYDLASDPGETRDLARHRPVRAELLLQRLEAWRHAWPASPPRKVQPASELEERLKALGYLQ